MNGLQNLLLDTLETVIDCDIEVSLIPRIRSAFKLSIDYFVTLPLTQIKKDDTLMTIGSSM